MDHYFQKNPSYYAGIRDDWFAYLSKEKKYRILEIGCGIGDNGQYAKSMGISSFYAGIELFEDAARQASQKVDEIICGNAEIINLPWQDEYFDVLFMSEVLEHLVDPEIFLKRISRYVRKGGLVFASSPNVSHYSVIKMLTKGDWILEAQGIMDETHLRWFTPKSYNRLFVECGFQVIDISPVSKFGIKAKIADTLTLGVLQHIFWRQINLKAIKL